MQKEMVKYFVWDRDHDTRNLFEKRVHQKHHEIESLLNFYENEDQSAAQEELFQQIDGAMMRMITESRGVEVEPVAELAEILQKLIKKMHQEHWGLGESLSELLLLILDKILLMARELMIETKTSVEWFDSIRQAVDQIIRESDSSREHAIGHAITLFAGKYSSVALPDTLPASMGGGAVLPGKIDEDLSFFKSLSKDIDNRHYYWKSRTEFMLPIALGMNGVSGNIVDYFQLEAAVYLHDLGMSFMPDLLLNRPSPLTLEERQRMHHHPNVGFEVVRRMPGWEEAANAIKQHHEYFDGSGYPQQLKGSETTNGAQILAICDAFFSLTHERADRYQPRSLIRAMAEINACSGSQFCPFWVEIFNVVVKIQQMAGQL